MIRSLFTMNEKQTLANATNELIYTLHAFAESLGRKRDDFTVKEIEEITDFLVLKADDYYTI